MSDSVTTYTTCWKVTLQDSTVLGFTDHDQDLTVDSVLYKSAVGYVPSAIRDTDSLSPGNMDIAGIISDDGISEDDLYSGRFDRAQIEIFMVDYNNTAAGAVMTLISGRLGQVMIKDHQFIAELNDLAHQMSGNIGELYGILCAAQLGDARCGVNMVPWTVSGTIPGYLRAKHFRILIDENGRQAHPIFDNIDVRQSSGGVDECTDPVNNASASSSGLGLPEFAFTDALTDGWGPVAPGVGDWVRYDFPAPITFYEYHLCQNPNYFAAAWRVQYSIDGVEWFDLDAVTGNSGIPTCVTRSLALTSGAEIGGTERVIADVSRTEADGHWNNGTLEFDTGKNAGYLRDIKRSFSDGTIELYEPLPYPIAVGDQYTITAGCGRTKDECKNRFNNLANHRGFPHLKGLSELFRGPQ